MEHIRTQQELIEALEEQIGFLISSCKAYDNGSIAEGKRMAVALRILLHDGKGRNKSLLTHLGIKEGLQFCSVSGAPMNPDKTVMYYGISFITTVNGVEYIPHRKKGDHPGFVMIPFSEWWNALVYKDGQATATRSDMVMSIADTDGGAHVDASIRGSYAQIAKNNIGGLNIITEWDRAPSEDNDIPPRIIGIGMLLGGLPDIPLEQLSQVLHLGPHITIDSAVGKLSLAFVRQIAYEVLATLEGAADSIGLTWPEGESVLNPPTSEPPTSEDTKPSFISSGMRIVEHSPDEDDKSEE